MSQALPAEAREAEARERLVLLTVNEAAMVFGEGLAESAEMIDLAMVLGTGWAPHHGGPLRYADDARPRGGRGGAERSGGAARAPVRAVAGAEEAGGGGGPIHEAGGRDLNPRAYRRNVPLAGTGAGCAFGWASTANSS